MKIKLKLQHYPSNPYRELEINKDFLINDIYQEIMRLYKFSPFLTMILAKNNELLELDKTIKELKITESDIIEIYTEDKFEMSKLLYKYQSSELHGKKCEFPPYASFFRIPFPVENDEILRKVLGTTVEGLKEKISWNLEEQKKLVNMLKETLENSKNKVKTVNKENIVNNKQKDKDEKLIDLTYITNQNDLPITKKIIKETKFSKNIRIPLNNVSSFFIHDEKIAFGTIDGIIYFYKFENFVIGSKIREFIGPKEFVNQIVFNDKYLAIASGEIQGILFDINTGKSLYVAPCNKPAKSTALSDKYWSVSSSEDSDTYTTNPLKAIWESWAYADYPENNLVIKDDILYGTDYDSIILRSLIDGSLIQKIKTGDRDVVFDIEDSNLIFRSKNSLVFMDLNTLSSGLICQIEKKSIPKLKIWKNLIITSNYDGKCYLIDWKSKEIKFKLVSYLGNIIYDIQLYNKSVISWNGSNLLIWEGLLE